MENKNDKNTANKIKSIFKLKFSKKNISIKTRILLSILCLIIVVFMIILVSFNILLDTYIKTTANEELTKSTEIVEHMDSNFRPIKPPQDDGKLPPKALSNFMRNVQDKVRMAETQSDADAMVVDSKYNLIFPTREDDFLKNIDEMESIKKCIQNEKLDLNSDENTRISTGSNDYYISTVKITSIYGEQDKYLILFIDISKTLNLVQKINIVLIFVMCFAGILAIFTAIVLSEKIAKPIKELCGFAKKMGQGDFRRTYFDFSDKELVELSNIMNKSAEYLDKYDNEQKIFFQNASHELRTPLMSIKGYAEAIKYNVIDSKHASDIILEESDRLSDMVEDLLYISKIYNITKDYELVECDLREVLSNCGSRQNVRAMNKGIRFVYEFDEEMVLFECDEKNVSKAFMNLIENALRYAKSEIKIVCKHNQKNIVVIVEDDGIGINKEDLPHIFERFYKGFGGNHGIGLSIVKSIVNKHGGRIYAENGKKGAKFTIVFKL